MASRSILTKFWRGHNQLVHRFQVRRLTLHEYQSHGILREFGIPVPLGKVATTVAEAEAIIKGFKNTCIIKPQILGSSVKAETIGAGFEDRFIQVNNAKAAGNVAKAMPSHKPEASKSSGGEILTKKLFITEMINHEIAWFLAITFDRENSCPIIIASKRGGIDMETMIQQYPEQFRTFTLGYTRGITREIVESISKFLDASAKERDSLQRILGRLYKVFTAKDATLLEIGSLARSHDGTLTCLDVRVVFDDAASKRQVDVFSLRDVMHEISEEVEAEKYGLVYVKMDGNIGNVVNGAGLAMATNDAIALYGGSSANFLDAGGQATKHTMVKAFEIILRDERVKTILVNIYGGIIRCDMIAESIVGAAKQLGPLKVPMVVRLQGTNSELGLKILEEADLGLHTEADFGKAAEKAVELARGSGMVFRA
ncbi:succinyl-CoA synthetase beta chain (CoA-ligase) [Colletotrichum graminicola]|nr:succinyl-CoA synthetase beta chain (CoA-ligase) [Colletotrichum graminicola]